MMTCVKLTKSQIQKKLYSLYSQKKEIEEQISLLEKELTKNKELSKKEKIELFKSLFISREDIFLKKWISKDGSKSSYFPVTTTFKKEDYIPISNSDIELHLRGLANLATYIISKDNRCKYAILKILENDKFKLQIALNKFNIEAYFYKDSKDDLLLWFFFEKSILAKEAKAFLETIVKEANISAKLYPNQDFVNSSSLGNYIELPLHLKHRENNQTVFLDIKDNEKPLEQWSYLQNIKKLSEEEVNFISKETALKKVNSWDKEENNIDYPNFKLEFVLYEYLYIKTKNLSKSFLNELKSLATFENPQIKLLLSLRKPLFNTPKFIKNFEEDEEYLKLPRGVLGDVIKICKKNSISYNLDDKRVCISNDFPEIKYELRDEQKDAIKKVMKKDFSICVAPPGFGKTLIGAVMIKNREVNALVLVNKNMLLDQWVERFVDYFGYSKKDIGILGKSKNRLNGKLDIATMQSLKNQAELIKNYSFVIVDECHHIPAVTFEQIIKKFSGKYLLGLSATPNRKDGLETILYQQLGKVSYEYRKKRTLTHQLKVVNTNFISEADNYAQLINDISTNEERNNIIIEEIKKYINRKILVLTDRIEHINLIEELLIKNNLNYVSIHGSLSKKEQQKSLDEIENNSLILATTSYFGEGIDFPHLNTIIFATPISYYGRLVQYLGRVGRDGQECLAIDLVDSKNAMLNSTFKKRAEGYKQMHYKIF